MKPKLIQKYYDANQKELLKLYEYPSGVRLVHCTRTGSIEMSAGIAFKAGSFYEKQLAVPDGTAHMVEHVIAGTPNRVLKTFAELSMFEYGSKRRAWASTNASTGNLVAKYYGYTNAKGSLRLLNYLKWEFEKREHDFAKQIERERGVILSEFKRNPEFDKDPGYQSDKFLTDNLSPDRTKRVIGNEESINAITAEDLIKFYQATYTKNRAVIGVQTGVALSKDEWKAVNELANRIGEMDSSVKLADPTDPTPSYKLEMFTYHDDLKNDVYLAITYGLKDLEMGYSPELHAYTNLLCRLVGYVAYKQLREEKALVYNATYIRQRTVLDLLHLGMRTGVDPKKLPETLDAIYDLFDKDIKAFIESERGARWLLNFISGEIYPSQPEHSRYSCLDDATNILFGEKPFGDIKGYRKIIRSLSLAQLYAGIEYIWQNLPPRLWLQVNAQPEETAELIKNSKLYKHFEKQKAKPFETYREFVAKFIAVE